MMVESLVERTVEQRVGKMDDQTVMWMVER